VIPTLAFDIFYLHTKFGDSRFNCFEDMIAGIEIDHDHAPFRAFRGGLSSLG